jgi:branched-chain amino acid transport system ATP-binding protein
MGRASRRRSAPSPVWFRVAAGSNSTEGRAASASRREEIPALSPILDERRDRLAGSLSGGEQQQLSIARALMSGPKLLLDEPSLDLAPQIVETIFDLIGRLRERGPTILLVEQNVAMALEMIGTTSW